MWYAGKSYHEIISHIFLLPSNFTRTSDLYRGVISTVSWIILFQREARAPRTIYHGVFLNATCFSFWSLGGWRWDWNPGACALEQRYNRPQASVRPSARVMDIDVLIVRN
jgi:hypothetical protein